MHIHHHNTGGIAIDSYACNSRLRHISAGFKAGFSMLLLLFCIFADHPVISVLLILFAASVTVFLGGIPLHDYLSVLGIPVFLCFFDLFTADWRFLPESVFLLPFCAYRHRCRCSLYSRTFLGCSLRRTFYLNLLQIFDLPLLFFVTYRCRLLF